MEQGIVTQQFIKCHNYLKDIGLIHSSSSFAAALGVPRQALNEILKGKRGVTIEMIRLAMEKFNINANFLFLAEGSMLVPNVSDRKPNITYVPIKAQAGYTGQINDPVFINDLEVFRIPDKRFSEGEFRCFEIEGESMEPTFYQGDKVICSYVDPVYFNHSLRLNQSFVIVTKFDVLLKRVSARDDKLKTVGLSSDNDVYPKISLSFSELVEVWKVEAKLTSQQLSPARKPMAAQGMS